MKNSKVFTKGVLEVLPLLIPVAPFGIIIGVIGIELGFSPLMVYATSLIVFSGSAQIVFFQLISGGASPFVTLTSVGVTNSRHLLYGAVLSEHLEGLSSAWKIFLSYFLVDQSFALSNRFFKENRSLKNKHYYLFGSGFTLWFTWQISSLIGIFLGSIVPQELGLSFAIPVTFLSLLESSSAIIMNTAYFYIKYLRKGNLRVSLSFWVFNCMSCSFRDLTISYSFFP